VTATATPTDRVGAAPEAPPRLRWWFLAVVVAAAVPRLWTAGRYVTTDEPTWLRRSERFSDAISQLDLSSATASLGEPATMPGGPTMWIGTISRALWNLADELGWVDSRSFSSDDGLAIAQHLAALVTALLIGWLFVTVARWVGPVPALLVAVVVATEPWLVGLGAVLHTDEMTALFGTIGLVTLARSLGLPDRARRADRPGWTAAIAGLALMGSALTKVTGVGYWTGAAVLAVWALVRHRRAGGGWWEVGSPLRLCTVAAAAGLAVVPVAWPAVVADPAFQLERLRASAGLGMESGRFFFGGSRQFYLGEGTPAPGWTYYPVASALRVTPWFLLALVVGVAAALARAASRRHAAILLVPVTALFAVLTRSPKSYDRYALVLLVPLAVVAAIGLDQLRRRFRLPDASARRFVAVSGVALLAYSVVVAPWGLAYFNPALGGGRAGHENLLVGWGEGKVVALERIRAMEGGDCADVSVEGVAELWMLGFPCATPPSGDRPADYVVVYVSNIQRDPGARDPVAGRELVEVVEIRGIPYVEIWA
jgi:hypothetical protein